MSVAFPIAPAVTFFDGPDENPLSEADAWRYVSFARPPLKRLGGNAVQTIPGDPNYSVYIREAIASGNVLDCFGCTAGGQLGDALETWRVALWLTPPEAVYGYLVAYGGGIGKNYFIRRYNGSFAAFTDLAGAGGGYPARLGIRIDGDAVQCWADDGSGLFVLMCEASDTTYRGTFYGSIGIEDPTAGGLSFSCFGIARKNRSQIYRRVQGGEN